VKIKKDDHSRTTVVQNITNNIIQPNSEIVARATLPVDGSAPFYDQGLPQPQRYEYQQPSNVIPPLRRRNYTPTLFTHRWADGTTTRTANYFD
jgi:hypothetical protein